MKNKLLRIVSLIIIAVSLFSFAACTDNKGASKGSPEGNAETGYVFRGKRSDAPAVELGTPEVALNPDEVYSKVTYIPEMFYGNYRLLGGEEAEDKFASETDYMEFKKEEKTLQLSTLPFGMRAGKMNLGHVVAYIEGYEWMQLSFMNKTETGSYLTTLMCAYSIEGNKISFKPLDSWTVDDNDKIDYVFTDYVLEYEFSFNGRNITLKQGNKSVTMTTGLAAVEDTVYFYTDLYAKSGSELLDGIDGLNFYYDITNPDTYFYVKDVNGETVYNPVGRIEENGLFTFTVPWEEGTKTYQFVYFYGARDGFVLTDGENTYLFTETYSERNYNDLKKYTSEDQTDRINELSETELEAIVEKKDNLLDEMVEAFNNKGISVKVDKVTGELQMDSSVLFGGDSAVLTDDGKALLDEFIKVYNEIVFSEKYDGFISKTMVEGHIAPVAGVTFDDGLPLSLQRAENVKNYCVQKDGENSRLDEMLEVKGMSNSKPVLDETGEVDMAASRRVSFRFIINFG